MAAAAPTAITVQLLEQVPNDEPSQRMYAGWIMRLFSASKAKHQRYSSAGYTLAVFKRLAPACVFVLRPVGPVWELLETVTLDQHASPDAMEPLLREVMPVLDAALRSQGAREVRIYPASVAAVRLWDRNRLFALQLGDEVAPDPVAHKALRQDDDDGRVGQILSWRGYTRSDPRTVPLRENAFVMTRRL